jgi:hypothetical protein
LEDPATYSQSGRAVEINREMTVILEDLMRLNAEWEAAALRMEELRQD